MYPKKVQIEITNRCNLKCNGCLRENMTRKKGDITYDTLLDALLLCDDFGIEKVVLHNWGEPLLHPNILKIIKIINILGFKVGFTTNGTLLTHDKLIELKEAGLDKLDISYNKNTKGFFLNPSMLQSFYHISNGLGIDTWFRSVVFSKEDYDKLKDELDGYNVRFQRGMYFDKNKIRNKPCKAIENLFIIQWDGTIVPCCAMYDNQYTYGTIWDITVDELKKEIDTLKQNLLYVENSCSHCFEVDSELPLSFKL